MRPRMKPAAAAAGKKGEAPATIRPNGSDQSQQQQQQPHPSHRRLDSTTSSAKSSVAAPPPPSIDTALLLQSAARSILNDSSDGDCLSPSSPASAWEDNDSTALQTSPLAMPMAAATSSAKNATTATTTTTSTGLLSLQRQRLPAMPDEQDRKRFLGCLAAVLASSYDVDYEGEMLSPPGGRGQHNATTLEAEYLVFDEYDDEEEEEEQEEAATPRPRSTNVNPPHSSYLLKGGDNDNTLRSTMASHLQSTDSFGDFSTASSSHTAAASSLTPGSNSRRRKRGDRVNVSRKRHRQRRYDVLSRLLLSSAEYLLLEKHQAKAFLPMLARILVPQQQPSPSPMEDPTQNRRSFHSPSRKSLRPRRGGGGGPSHTTVVATSSSSAPPPTQSSPSTDPAVLEAIQNAPIDDFESRDSDIANRLIDEIDHLRPFLESMTPGGGFRCLTLVLLQHLMHSRDGYDARIRQALKMLGVIILYRDMYLQDTSDLASDVRESSYSSSSNRADLVTLATRRFESLEHCLAESLLKLSKNDSRKTGKKQDEKARSETSSTRGGYSREQIVRGVKVGAMGVAAAGLFAFTGGLAAPGIVAAIPALSAASAAAAGSTSIAVVTAMFGVGGGGLVAYKMNRRTMGLTEFEFRKETGPTESPEAELFTTICISGWLRDECDFQRPWGVSPANPWIKDRQELLERFYAVFRPDHVTKSARILQSWENEEDDLWALLREKYGRDPDHLYPLEGGPREDGALTLDQREVMDALFVELRYSAEGDKNKASVTDRLRFGWNRRKGKIDDASVDNSTSATGFTTMDSLHGPHQNTASSLTGASSSVDSHNYSDHIGSTLVPQDYDSDDRDEIPKHIDTVWDYKRHYGGELYTIRWESALLEDLCESVRELAYDMVRGGTQQILKHTALQTILSAIAWPAALINAANMIDGTWTLAVERADEAGKELARSLLFSQAGHRPITLVGFSFGARTIYSCLKEMAKYQEKWYKYQEELSKVKQDERSKRSTKVDPNENEPLSQMREPTSIIEDVVIMGLPNHLSIASWKACRQVVSGRLINCFSQKDLILSLMFQFKRLGLKPVCGTLPVSVPGVENFDVSDLVSAHSDYCTATGRVLKRVRLGEPFRSKPTRYFEPDAAATSERVGVPDKFDV